MIDPFFAILLLGLLVAGSLVLLDAVILRRLRRMAREAKQAEAQPEERA